MAFHKIIRIPEHPARADKSGLEMHYATFGYASLWLMQRGAGRDKSAPTVWITHIVTWPVPGHRTSSVRCFAHVFSACLVYDVVALPQCMVYPHRRGVTVRPRGANQRL